MKPMCPSYDVNKTLVRLQVVRLGKILFNLQFIALFVMFASLVAFLVPIVFSLVLVFLAFITLFMIFLNPWYRSLWNYSDTMTQIVEVMAHSWQYTVPIVMVLAFGSIVCLSFDREQKHLARMVTSGIFGVLALVVMLAKIINQGVWA